MKDRNLEHSNDWATPKTFYDTLHAEFDFQFDAAPFMHNMEWNGLEIEYPERTYLNPPYELKLKTAFFTKAVLESKKGKLVVCLLPVSTSTELYHKIILPNITEPIRFLYKRLRFSGWNTKGEWVENKTGMHDSMIVIFDGRKKENN